MSSNGRQPTFVFGPYVADFPSGELRKGGLRIKIQDMPLRLLGLLAERPGQVITREELHKRLWPSDTFLDFEGGLNTAARKLREALCDDAENPRYIETVPRRGYRFLAEVKQLHPPAQAPVALAEPSSSAALRGQRSRWKTWALASAAVLVLLGGVGVWLLYGRPAFSFNSRDSILVTDSKTKRAILALTKPSARPSP